LPTDTSPNHLLEAADLACMRGDRILFKGVGLRVASGELLHVRGPNGAGKTTLLRILCGLVRPEAGTVSWDGEAIAESGERYLAELTYVGHMNAIKDELTGVENLCVSASLSGVDVTPEAASDALRRIGLKGTDDIPAKVLSQGQRRRTALARLLLDRSSLWVLDEPFNALDVAAVETLKQAMHAHLDGGGMVVLTTHQDVPMDGATVNTLQLGP